MFFWDFLLLFKSDKEDGVIGDKQAERKEI